MRNAHRLVALAAVFALVVGTSVAQDWPQWRGPNRDNKLAGFTEPKVWPKELTRKWTVPVGIGEASPVLVGDKLYTFGRQGDDEVAACLDAATGKEIWRDKYASAKIGGPAAGYQGPRSTLAVGEGKVCTLGVRGAVSCLDAASGKVVWRKGSKPPQYYTSTSPLIIDGHCIVFADALTSFDLATGSVSWTWSGAGAPYGSPVLMTVGGVKMVVTPAMGALVGVDRTDGKLLWQTKIGADYQSTYSTPLVEGTTVFYSSGGGNRETFALKIDKADKGFQATELWRKPFAADKYHTPVLADGMIFGVSGGARGLFCASAKTGEQLWTDKTQRGECGSILNAGSVLLELSNKELVAFRASGKGYVEVAKYRVADADTWCVPIVAGNRIYVKDRGGSLTLWTLE
jgi:outer membrane protein assembly factor BamB